MTLADRLIVLNDGYAEQIDTPLNVYENPATEFVGGFIGSPPMNFFSGSVSGDGSKVELDSGSTLTAGKYATNDIAGTKVRVGIRAEKLTPCAKEDAELVLNVVAIETLGAETLAHGLMENGDTVVGLAESIVVKLPGDVRPKVDEELPLRVAEDGLHLFDSESGKRI